MGSVNRSVNRNTEQNESDHFQREESADNFASRAKTVQLEIPECSRNCQKLSKGRSFKCKLFSYPRKPGALPVRPGKQKSRVLLRTVYDDDITTYYQRPKFTLQDFIVKFSTGEDVPANVVEEALYSPLTHCSLQSVLTEKRSRLENSELSTQQLRMPDDLPEVQQRVPRQQLLVEMAVVVRKQLSKVLFFNLVCRFHLSCCRC